MGNYVKDLNVGCRFVLEAVYHVGPEKTGSSVVKLLDCCGIEEVHRVI